MQKFFKRLLAKIVFPLVGALLEEGIKLILEAVNDNSMNQKDRVYYVIDGVANKMDEIQNKL